MDENELFKMIGYIMATEYRQNIIRCHGNSMKTPSKIAKEVGLRTNHVSNVLKSLKDNKIVVCLNEDARKGRLYKNTELGLKILENI